MQGFQACIIEELALFILISANLHIFMENFHDHMFFYQIFTLKAIIKILIDIVNTGLCTSLINGISMWLKSWAMEQSTKGKVEIIIVSSHEDMERIFRRFVRT